MFRYRKTLWFAMAVGCILLALSLIWANDRRLIKNDLKRLEGKWAILRAESGGVDITTQFDSNEAWVTFKGDAWLADRLGRKLYTAENSRIQIDPSSTPKTFDHVVVRKFDGNSITLIYLGIYDIDGDTLKMCFDTGLKNRPTTFQTNDGTKHFMAILRRLND